MMRSVRISFALLLWLFAVASLYAQHAYFPLAIGNTWQFKDAQHQFVIVGDTILQDGHHYSVIYDTWYRLRTYERQQGDSVFRSGSLLYDFSKNVGDTVWRQSSIVCMLTSIDTVNYWGRRLRQWHFVIEYDHVAAEVHEIVDSLGLVATAVTDGIGLGPLNGATIDNITYGTVSGVDDIISLPNSIVVEQNYPNPFNPITRIPFSLSRKSHIQATVRDLNGRLITQLADSQFDPGRHEFVFSGSQLSSGIYLFELMFDNSRSVVKMVLIK